VPIYEGAQTGSGLGRYTVTDGRETTTGGAVRARSDGRANAAVIMRAGSYWVCGWLESRRAHAAQVLATTDARLSVAPLQPTLAIGQVTGAIAGAQFPFEVYVRLPPGVPMNLSIAVLGATRQCPSASSPGVSSGGTGATAIENTTNAPAMIATAETLMIPQAGGYRICAWLKPAWPGADLRHTWTGPVTTELQIPATEVLAAQGADDSVVNFGFAPGWGVLERFQGTLLVKCSRPVWELKGGSRTGPFTSLLDTADLTGSARVWRRNLTLQMPTLLGGRMTLSAHVHAGSAYGTMRESLVSGPPDLTPGATCASGPIPFAVGR
jgi:hypothetical protein